MLYYQEIIDHYEKCLAEHGATHRGVDWPNVQDMETRFEVMLGLCDVHSPLSLLDLGCGYGALLDHIMASDYADKINYKGIDISAKMIAAAEQKHAGDLFQVQDVLKKPLPENNYDYVIMNGLFTERCQLSQAELETFLIDMVKMAYRSCKRGVAFNVMNFHVDWYREDLFYLPFDRLAVLLKQHCSRHFTIRADYGLYEYTVYLYKRT